MSDSDNTPRTLAGRSLLVVGAGGFIGGFICAEGLRRGMKVTAGVRADECRALMQDFFKSKRL